MLYVKQIQKLFNIDENFAREVMDRMVLDFSESSWEEFEREARFAMNRITDDILKQVL